MSVQSLDPSAQPSTLPTTDRRPHVLVVDGNRDAAHALATVAELLGCETRVCYGGTEALAALQKKLPDAILLDLTMPGGGGLEVVARAREMAGRRALLLVATTDMGELEDRTETALAGFHFHLVKPIDAPALQPMLDALKSVRHAGPWRRRYDWWEERPKAEQDSPVG